MKMQFDPQNPVIKLCALGMEKEGENLHEEAAQLFEKAWNEANDNFEKYVAAHYLARQQKTIREKLNWDKKALDFALLIGNDEIKGSLPSLYLNIAKGYEDLGDFDQAKENYRLALSLEKFLSNDGYGQLILSGIRSGLQRIESKINNER